MTHSSLFSTTRLTQAAAANYTIYAIVMNEEEIVVDKVGGEIVVV